MLQKIPPVALIKHKIFFCENTIFVKKIIGMKKFTRICEYVVESDRFSGKSFKWAKSRHSEDSKLVKKVYIVLKNTLGRHD